MASSLALGARELTHRLQELEHQLLPAERAALEILYNELIELLKNSDKILPQVQTKEKPAYPKDTAR